MVKIMAMSCSCVDVFPEQNKVAVGGNALNVAVSCKRSKKAEVYLAGNIGTDSYAKAIVESIDSFGIHRECLHVVEGDSANHVVHIDSSGDRYFTENSWTNGVYGDYKITPEDENRMKQMDGVATTLYDPEYRHILEIRKNSDFLLSVDFHDEKLNPEWEKDFDAIDLFFKSGKEEEFPMMKEWSLKYPTIFVATLGAKGSVTFYRGKEYWCDAVEVKEVVDTTGCGDSYQGAFIADYLTNQDIKKAMQAGSESAALTLGFVGGV